MSAVDPQWRHRERDALVSFATNAVLPGGFGYLDAHGRHQGDHGCELWINGRFTHVFACEVLRGNTRAWELLDHGMGALTHSLHDDEFGGWFRAVDTQGHGPLTPADTVKEAYSHAFVVLAAAGALQAGHPEAADLLEEAVSTTERYWWEPEHGRVRESASRNWTSFEPYRGINANMHTVESMLAVHDATGDTRFLDRAVAVCDFVLEGAAGRIWRILEHYTSTWQPQPEYNRDRPADPFRPYGATVGHAFEWARLSIQAHVTKQRHGTGRADLSREIALIRQALADGWAVDGAPGFVYTTDFDGRPVAHERMHWVVCEAINALVVLRAAARELSLDAQIDCDAWERVLWDYAREHLIASPGHWREELDSRNQLSERTWTGMPEIYHAYQTLVLPDGDYASGFARAAKGLRED
ncbi:AGE family epimerase/isomerase [Schaalia sp. 19OD2882]|uniref:AGE family epimerase/isomerase n=1 Tax=Schaalia sp. 19OD2882 TaxID=2794089 RepID=UPI001C1EBAA4|nr:AGE family epimerase/isomerase [Schaalia sp. 19OD2882]QWW19996.1 AGE family epimerase/isomerase [Schaalia sp. 19OD2882]